MSDSAFKMPGASEMGVRPFRPEADTDFLYNSWLRSYKAGSHFAKRIRHHVFFPWHKQVIARFLERENAHVLIAHEASDPRTILGYLAWEWGGGTEEPIIHYAYVKEHFRKQGVARRLFIESKIPLDRALFTHWTAPVGEIIEKYPSLTYDPYRI